MKKIFSVLMVSLAVVSVLVFANRETKNESKSIQKPLPVVNQKTILVQRKKWEASYDKIKKEVQAFTPMEAMVTSFTFKHKNANSSGPKWFTVKIKNEKYLMQFTSKEFEKLKNLKVNYKIIIKSRSASLSPNHPYLIL